VLRAIEHVDIGQNVDGGPGQVANCQHGSGQVNSAGQAKAIGYESVEQRGVTCFASAHKAAPTSPAPSAGRRQMAKRNTENATRKRNTTARGTIEGA